MDVRFECSWAPRVALQDVCRVKSRRWSSVYEIDRCERAAFLLIRKNANSNTDLTTRHENVELLEIRVLLFFLELILICVALASENSSEKLRLCHALSLRLMVSMFDPLSVFFVVLD